MEEQAGVKTDNRNACRIYCLDVFKNKMVENGTDEYLVLMKKSQ